MNKDVQREHKAIMLAHKPMIVYIITVLMFVISSIYFYAAYEDHLELLHTKTATSAYDIASTKNEMTFFLVVSISYIAIALWMLFVEHKSKIPYIIAIVGSAALIVFYILTRIIDIPTIGLQTDVGIPDILAKTFQGIIIAIASFLMVSMIIRKKRLENYQGIFKRGKTFEEK